MNRPGKISGQPTGCAAHSQTVLLRSGFTVLELMVSMSLVALVLGLLLPAVMSLRETSRKMECSNRLRQLGLAVHAYHAQANRLPAAWSPVVDSERFVEAWSAQLLPYIEQQACADRLRSTPAANLYQDPDKLAELQVPSFLCPSDIAAPCFALTYFDRPVSDTVLSTSAGLRSSSDHGSAVPTFLPSANYIGVFGTVEADEFEFAETEPIQPYGDGSIVHDVRVRLDDLQHGTAQTIVVGERTMAKIPSTWWGVDLDGDDAGCRVAGSAITHPNCEVCDECEFSSRHVGGSMFLWGDGHVTLLTQSIDTEVYRGVAKRGY